MSQRNPLNERYQNSEEKTGKTRKSAASAKPATKAASSVYIQGKVEEPKGIMAQAQKRANKTQTVKNSKKQAASKDTVERRRDQALRAKYYNPDTPEYKKYKRVWWGMLAGAILCTAISFWASGQESLAQLTYVLIGISYVLLIVAILFDFMYLRKLRNEYQDKMIALEKSKKNSVRRKEEAAAARAAKDAEEEAAEAEEDRKLFRGLFTRKRASNAVAVAKSAQARAANEALEE